MNLPLIKAVQSQDHARQLAIDWQHDISQKDLSYQELSQYQDYFYKLAEKFGLMEEFSENGII